MKPEEKVRAILERYVEKAYAGASLIVTYKDKKLYNISVGFSQLKPYRIRISVNTLFDIASLTKCISSSIIAMKLIEEGMMHLKDRVIDILPEFKYTEAGANNLKEKVKVWMLLAHTSGLPSWIPLYTLGDRERIIDNAVRSFITYEPGSKIIYSDVGFIVLTAIIERLSGERIDRLFDKMIRKPLKLERTLYNPLDKGISIDEIAATEYDNDLKAYLKGIPHDKNARSMNNVSGHAGLFSTAYETSIIARSLLRAYKGSWNEIVSPQSVRIMFRSWFCDDQQCYGLGWQVYDPFKVSSAGDLLTPHKAFGHTGFTGTSIWIDLDLDAVIVFYTNRVHLSRDNVMIHRVRPLIHNYIVSNLKDLG